MEPDEGSASEQDERAAGDVESEDDSPFENDVEPIRDETESQSGELMTVTRALKDVPDYLKPFAQCERRPALKDVCWINHPDRNTVITPSSYAEACATAAATPMSAATSASQSAPEGEDARAAASGRSRDDRGEDRRSRRRSRRESRGAPQQSANEGGSVGGRKNDRREQQSGDRAEDSKGRPQGAGSVNARSRHVPKEEADWAESPSSSFQRRGSRRQPGGVELSSWSTSFRSDGNIQHRESASQEPQARRLPRTSSHSKRETPRSGGRADSLGAPLTQRASEGREVRSGSGGDEQVVDSEREDPAGDVETVGEGHTEELSGGNSHQHQSLESALSSIPEDLRRTVHS